jgi:hypothetical protein
LLSRRTQLLGALTAVGVMFNVVLLNLCYDVPVKLYSSTLLMLALFLMVRDLPRLSAVLLRRPLPPLAPPAPPPARFGSRRWRAGLAVAEVVAAGLVLLPSFLSERQRAREFAAVERTSPLEGTWSVERQVVDGRELPPTLSEAKRWRTLTVSHYKTNLFALARQVDDASLRIGFEVDASKHRVKLMMHEQPSRVMTYALADAEHVTISDDKKQTVLELRKLPPRPSLLMTRGFHWVNEEPFQR